MMLDKLRNLFRCVFRVFRGYMNSIYEQYLETDRKKRRRKKRSHKRQRDSMLKTFNNFVNQLSIMFEYIECNIYKDSFFY